MSKSICVVGQGFVGGSLTTVFAERGLDVYVYDKMGKVAPGGIDILNPIADVDNNVTTVRMNELAGLPAPELEPGRTMIQQLVAEVEKIKGFTGVYFVCLPTPMQSDGHADLTIVDRVLNELSSVEGKRIAVIKSTVPPGSTEAWNKKYESTGLRIIFNPEFLREATALDDMRNQNRIVLGGPRPYINKVKQVFEFAFPNVPIIKTSSSTAEMVKYVTNIHLAVKVSLANEFYQICEALDAKGANIDYDKVVEYATYDERLGTSHWKVPGPMPDDVTGEPSLGYGGSCFVKDINALIALANQLGVDPKVMKASWAKNLEVRPQRDWEHLLGRAVSKKEQ